MKYILYRMQKQKIQQLMKRHLNISTRKKAGMLRLNLSRKTTHGHSLNSLHISEGLDVKSAFLHGGPNEEVYVDQRRGYEKSGREHCVYKLHKALYGLKQAPRAWYIKIEAHFLKQGDVEDLMKKFKTSMIKEFDISDLGYMNYFLGIEVTQGNVGIFICQKRYVEELLERFGMSHNNSVCNPIVPGTRIDKDIGGNLVDETYYKQIVGSLMYLTSTRPDIMFATSSIIKSMSRPSKIHKQIAKRILRYLKGTTDYGIFYQKGAVGGELVAYTDSDYARDTEDMKSTTGYVFKLSSGVVTWSSEKQSIVTLSIREAEFMAATFCASQAIWMKRIL
ncbi:transmembrane signal receptor [Lithospermum erythrorhizon]|uniref:Transmembrane signal receptor n=1 Tax=Lithospermum erythrorhizon TaxID=34254 RepID=A0AAV3QXX8_LITER